MIRAVGYLLSEAIWSLVFRIAPQRFEQDDDPQSTADATAVRTEWIQKNRPLNGGWR
jgi:hypothetical protein